MVSFKLILILLYTLKTPTYFASNHHFYKRYTISIQLNLTHLINRFYSMHSIIPLSILSIHYSLHHSTLIPFHSSFSLNKQANLLHTIIHSFNCAAEVIHPQLTKKSNSFCLLSTSIVIFAPSLLPIPFLRLTLLPFSHLQHS